MTGPTLGPQLAPAVQAAGGAAVAALAAALVVLGVGASGTPDAAGSPSGGATVTSTSTVTVTEQPTAGTGGKRCPGLTLSPAGEAPPSLSPEELEGCRTVPRALKLWREDTCRALAEALERAEVTPGNGRGQELQLRCAAWARDWATRGGSRSGAGAGS